MEMRKILFAALFMFCIVAVMEPALCAGSISVSTITASVTFTGQGVVNFSISYMNISGGTTTQIWWDPSLIIGGYTNWVGAGAYIVLKSTITLSNGGIEIYTNNRAADANPLYKGGVQVSSGAANPTGLVDVNYPRKLFVCAGVSRLTH